MNHPEAISTKIDASPIRIPNTTIEPPIPHVLPRLEAPLPLLLPGVWVGEGGGGVDKIEDKDEGTGGNEIDVLEGPTPQNH